MSRQVKNTKKTSFYFFEKDNQFTRSNINSHASRRDTILLFRKYRNINNLYKEEKRQFGRLLPSTIIKPSARRPRTTYNASS